MVRTGANEWLEGGGGLERHRGGYRAGVRLFQTHGWRAVEGQGRFMVGLRGRVSGFVVQ